MKPFSEIQKELREDLHLTRELAAEAMYANYTLYCSALQRLPTSSCCLYDNMVLNP